MFDIFFISYREPNADSNWYNLLNRFPYAKRLHGVQGIHQAHKTVAQTLGTSHFWVVDGDSIVIDSFSFVAPTDIWADAVYVYRAKNPVNDLSYGYGGIKLLPRDKTANMTLGNVDMTTSISNNFFPIDTIASTTNFNTDPFNTWKSAFRECVKLSSKTIEGQIDNDTEQRLNTWCSVGDDQPYGQWSIQGAQQGKQYGTVNKDNLQNLKLINNFAWLENKFKELYD